MRLSPAFVDLVKISTRRNSNNYIHTRQYGMLLNLARAVTQTPHHSISASKLTDNYKYNKYQTTLIRNISTSPINYAPKYKIAKLPSLSPTMEHGVIKCWEKQVGDFLEEGDTLAQIETDKAVMAMETPYKGYLARILQQEGATGISINEPIALIVSKESDIKEIASLNIEQLLKNEPSSKNEQSQKNEQPSKNVESSKNYPKHKLVKLPSLSPTMEYGTLTAWKKSVGDLLDEGDELALVETDKAVMSMETPFKGYLAKILVAENTANIEINAPIAIITPKIEDVPLFDDFVLSDKAPTDTAIKSDDTGSIETTIINNVSSDSTRIKASPYAKKVSKELNADLSHIAGTGPYGRIIADDVKTYVANTNANANIKEKVSEMKTTIAGEPKSTPAAVAMSTNYVDIPLTNMRKVIATRLTESKQTIPHYYLTSEIYVDKLIELRSEFNKQLGKDNVKLSLNDFVVKAASICLATLPASNSAWMGTFIRQFHNVDINIAVSTEGGLITPFVRDVNQKGLIQISKEIKDLAGRARNNKLSLNEYQGGTFTISNLGMYGITSFCAVINPPQSAILAVGGVKRVVVPDEENNPVIKSVMQITLSADHRIIDGAEGAVWVRKFKNLMEDPINMIL